MRKTAKSIASSLTAILVLSLLGSTAPAQFRTTSQWLGPVHAVQVAGTIYGAFDYNFEGTGAWVGYALIKIGSDAPKTATFADRNTSFGMRDNGSIYGTETISLLFTDGTGDFDIQARFEGVPASTPGLYNLHEVGTIANGSGKYTQVGGNVSVEGPFLFPDPSVTAGAPPWIAEIHGAITGITR